MRRTILAATLALAPLAGAALAQSQPPAQPAPLTPEQVQALMVRVIANQHRDDTAIEEYERVERVYLRKTAQDSPLDDKTYRVVPTGTGTIRVQLENAGRPVDAEVYRQQLRQVAQALQNAVDPNNSRQKQDLDKFNRRRRERSDMVDATLKAFLFTYLGREIRSDRALIKLGLAPNPAYKPASRSTSLFQHVRATIWIDEQAEQVHRIEAEIISDISFGGGIIGKVYRGGRFTMEQAEVAPGVWLPTFYTYDFDGRRFLFGFSLHQRTEANHYHRIGPPAEALAAIRRELNHSPGST